MAQFFDNDILCHNRVAHSNIIETCAEETYKDLTLGSAVRITSDFELHFCSHEMKHSISSNPRVNPRLRHSVKKDSIALLVDFKPYVGNKIGLTPSVGEMFEYVELEKIARDKKPHSFFVLPVWLIDNKVFSADIHPIAYEVLRTGGGNEDKHWRVAAREAKEKIYKYFIKTGRINDTESNREKFLSNFNSVSLSRKDTNIVKHATSNVYVLDNDQEPFVSIILPSKNLSSNNFIVNLSNEREDRESDIPLIFPAKREHG